MPRRVQTTSDGVGGRHHVRHGEQQRSDAHHHRAETDPARDVATTTQVAHDDRRQDAADLHRRRDQARVRAADLEPLLDGRDDAVHVAGRQRTCTSALIVFKRFFSRHHHHQRVVFRDHYLNILSLLYNSRRTFPQDGIPVQAGRDCQVVPGKHGFLRFRMTPECRHALTGMPPLVVAMEEGRYGL